MTIALRPTEVARAAGVNRQTLRYYERRGLLAEPQRTLGGHRLYKSDAVATVRAIKAAQRLGFTLAEIAALTTRDARQRRRPSHGLQLNAEAKLAEIEQRIAELEDIAALLRTAQAAGCDDVIACATTPECPLPFTHST